MNRRISKFIKPLKPLILPIVGLSGLAIFLGALWFVQQRNIENFQNRIQTLETAKNSAAEIVGFEKDLLIARNAVYGVLVQALGGAFFFATTYFTWRNVKAAEQKQITERFSKAVEQLDSDKPMVQLGAIYLLEKIASDSEKDYWTSLEVLTSFVRTISSIDNQEISDVNSRNVQAALTVIGRRNIRYNRKGSSLDLSHSNLAKFNLTNASFQGVNFEETDFTGARLENADLKEAYLSKAILKSAKCNGANLESVNHKFAVKKIDFSNASLNEANLTKARLKEADLSHTDLRGAILRSAYLYRANFTSANLVKADLTEADLSIADLRSANLDDAMLKDANIYMADFSNAEGLKLEQIKSAKCWKDATYDDDFRQALGL